MHEISVKKQLTRIRCRHSINSDTKTMSQEKAMDYVRSQYRLRGPLDKWLKGQAEKNNRSKNGELNAILEREASKDKKQEVAA